MPYKPGKNRLLRRLMLMLLVVALVAFHDVETIAKEKDMPSITLRSLPIAEAATAHRVVFAGDTPRMILGAMAADRAALALFEVSGQTAIPLATIGLLLPARPDFDLKAANRGGEMMIAYEYHGGATSEIRVQPLGANEALELPPRKTIVNERRPRFVRGGGTAVVINENEERAVFLEGGPTPHRVKLCTCLDAIAMQTSKGLAVMEKTLRPGAQIGDSSPGGLTLKWPRKTASEASHVLFEGRDVFDYDAVIATDSIWIAAVTENGLEVMMITPDTMGRSMIVAGLPEGLDAFSPALCIDGKVLRIAILAKSPLDPGAPSVLFHGVYQW